MNNALMLELEQALVEGIDEFKGEFGNRDGKLFPSDLGIVVGDGGCKRAFWHKLRNAPTKKSEPGRGQKMLMGDYLEEMVVDLLTRILPKHGYRVKGTQVYVPVPGTTGGKADILIENLETGELEVIEVKSTGEKQARFLPKGGHVLQTQSYMRGLGATRGHVVYIFREGNELPQSYKVARDDEKVEARAADLVALAEGPEPPKTDVAWQTRYCDLETCRCKGAN